jgi:hypothetical protein
MDRHGAGLQERAGSLPGGEQVLQGASQPDGSPLPKGILGRADQ